MLDRGAGRARVATVRERAASARGRWTWRGDEDDARGEGEDLMREIASVERSDLTLVCSPVEKRWLERGCGISEKKRVVARLF